MAEENLKIVITVEDNASDVIDDIEKKITSSGKNIQKQSTKTSASFEEQITSLVALGNAANGVDRIFSNYQNLQLRLENSTERLANAQDRLREAQYKLSKVQKDTSATAEDVANAQQDVESASRGLTIAQNNLARTNNAVVGTYIQMGTGVAQLIGSLPTLIGNLRTLTATSAAFVATPLGLTLVAIGGLIAAVTLDMRKYNEETAKAVERVQEIKSVSDDYNISVQKLRDSTFGYADAIQSVYDKLNGVVSNKTNQEIEANAKLKDADYQLLLAKKSNEDEMTIFKLQNVKRKAEAELELLRAQREALGANLELQKTNAENEKGLRTDVNNFWKLGYDEQLKYLKENFTPQVDTIRKESFDRETARVDELYKQWVKLTDQQAKYFDYTNKRESGKQNVMSLIAGVKTAKVKDAVIKPDGSVIQTDPADYLIATKNPSDLGGGGISVTITGNIYGTDASDISKALVSELRRKINI